MTGFEYHGYVNITLVVILGFFTFASFLLAFATLMNALRLRNVLISWKEGRLGGYPLFATFFLILSAILLSVALHNSISSYYPVVFCYVFFSCNWVISSYFMSKRFITDNGIVKNINDPSQTIAWSDIHDYIEHETETGYMYVFMYSRFGARKNSDSYLRLELSIPKNKSHAFKKILDHKLGRRFQQIIDDAFIKSQINPEN